MLSPILGLVTVLMADDLSKAVMVAVLVLAIAGGMTALFVSWRVEGYVTDLERSRSEFRRALVRLGEALGASDDRSTLVAVVLETTQALVAADSAVFWADTGRVLVARSQRGAEVAQHRIEFGEGMAGWVAEHGQSTRWPPSAVAPASGEPPAGAALSVPLKARGRLFGVLSLYRRSGSAPFTASDLDDVISLARQAETAIDTTYLHEESRRLSLTDGLTGLWNRRQFELRAAQELERATRFGEHFSIVLVDLDRFKDVNDTHGHVIGDAVLVETAQRLTNHTREVDTVARYGGEEFVLLLPQTELEGAMRVAEKVREELALDPVITEAGPVTVTLSAGVASHPANGATLGALLAAADEALYGAKGSGKNRVTPAAVEPGVQP